MPTNLISNRRTMNSYWIGFGKKIKFLNIDKNTFICKDSDIMSSVINLIKKFSQEYLRFIQPNSDGLKSDADERYRQHLPEKV